MTDKEMMELAAKAAGRLLPHGNPALARPNEELHHDGEQYWFWPAGDSWNPLTDDGDALRLAVTLGLTINPCKAAVFVSRNEDESVTLQTFGADRSADTRRAVTRAAAEIGRSA